jgi:periplasmic divalent cation tolerance protein
MIIIKTTSDSHKAMKVLTNTLLKEKKVACVTMIPRVRSKFMIEGRITESREVILLIKTDKRHEEEVYETIRQLHNYEIPEIVTIETSKVDSKYLEWMNESLQ